MRRAACLVVMLVLTATMLACKKSTTPPRQHADNPAPTQVSPSPHQPDTSAIDSAISANVGDPTRVRETLATLQDAVRKHDAAAVAALVSYPITINPHKPNALIIRTPATFVARYDQIITPHIAEVIEKQKYEDLFVNYQGAMLGDGEVWVAGICRDKTCSQIDIRIRTIQNTSGKPK